MCKQKKELGGNGLWPSGKEKEKNKQKLSLTSLTARQSHLTSNTGRSLAVVKTLPPNAGGWGSIPGQRAKIPRDSWPKTKA